MRAARVLLVCCMSACASGGEWSGALPAPDGEQFVSKVYPVLLRDCAFSTCHGAGERFFHVVGPGRARLEPLTTKPDDPATLAEVLHSYERARSMLATAEPIDQSLFLRKPLEIGAGGQGHKGLDDYGRNLYATQADPGYVVLSRWAHSSGLPPTAAQVAALNSSLDTAP